MKLFPSGNSLAFSQHLASMCASWLPAIEMCPSAQLMAVLKKVVCHAWILPSTGYDASFFLHLADIRQGQSDWGDNEP